LWHVTGVGVAVGVAVLHVEQQNEVAAVTLDIVPDEDNPHAYLAATDADGGEIARHRVVWAPSYSFSTATAWVESGCLRPD